MDLKQKSIEYYKGLYPEFSYKLYNEQDMYYGVASKQYNSVVDINNSKFFKEAFSQVDVKKNGNIVNVSLIGLSQSYVSDVVYDEKNITINLGLPYVVTNNSANKIDPVTNVYSWYVGEDTQDITFSFDSSKIYVYDEKGNQSNNKKTIILISCVIGGLLVLVGLVFGIKIYKNKNEIM